MVQRVGSILRGKQKSEWRAELARCECSLRKKFADTQLPPPVLKYVTPSPVKKGQRAACSQKRSIVDESPALKFDDQGNVKTDMACMARSEGLAVGSACCVVKNMKGIRRNRTGTVTSIGETELTVTFSADDAAGLAEVTLSCPLNALKAHDPTPAGKKAKKANAAVEQPVANGIEWKSYDDAIIEQAVRHHMTAFVEQLRIQQSPTHSDVAILDDQSFMVVAKKELQPLALRIIPRTNDLRLAATGEDVDITVDFTGGGDTVQFTTVGVEDNLGRLHGTTLIIDPFEFIAASSDAARKYRGVCVELKRIMSGVLSVPFGAYTTTDANLRPSQESQVAWSARSVIGRMQRKCQWGLLWR